MREKRFFVTLTPAPEPGEDHQERCCSPRAGERPHCLEVRCASEEHQHEWIRDCGWQELRRRGQQVQVGDAVRRTIQALRR